LEGDNYQINLNK